MFSLIFFNQLAMSSSSAKYTTVKEVIVKRQMSLSCDKCHRHVIVTSSSRHRHVRHVIVTSSVVHVESTQSSQFFLTIKNGPFLRPLINIFCWGQINITCTHSAFISLITLVQNYVMFNFSKTKITYPQQTPCVTRNLPSKLDQ